MNIYTKKTKKFILVLVLLLLFNFFCPKKAHAAFEFEDILAAPANIFWFVEKGILTFLNDLFTNEENKADTIYQGTDAGVTESVLKIALTPDNIIKGKFILFDADIFRKITIEDAKKDPKVDGYYDIETEVINGKEVLTGAADGKMALRDAVAGWYYALRNFAIVALLSVLVYVGIRMITSTISQDKAKYKIMFKDWLVALCLVVLMHYMMIAILNISSMITKALGSGPSSNMLGNLSADITAILNSDANSYTYTDPVTNKDMGLPECYAKVIVVGGIIAYTFIFAVKYLKREFTIMFLILLGPVSCITYPIDKISDGKAQAFNKWFSEFLYQVIIQPFHLLLYIVLIGMSTQLADENVIYALVCFAVMMPAEKFVKEMFGFKDSLGSPLGAFAGGAMAQKALSALTKDKGPVSSGKGGKGGNDGESGNDGLPPKTVDKKELGGGDSDSEEQGQLPAGNTEDQQAMLDADKENYGSDDYDAQLIDAQERELNSGDDQENQMSDEEYEQLLRDSGMTDEEIEEEMNKGKDRDSDDADTNDTDTGDVDTNANLGEGETQVSKGQGRWSKLGRSIGQQVYRNGGAKGLIKKGTKALAKGALGVGKGALIGTVAAAGMAGAIMTGNGKEALAIAGATAAYAGSKAIGAGKKAIKGAVGVAKFGREAIRSDASKEKKAFKAFQADQGQIDKAIASYKKNHDGNEPSYEQLDQEMQDRFALSRYGLSDGQIDKAVGDYQELKAGGMDDEKALQETAYEAQLAEAYKGKFGKEKDMQQALNDITNQFVAAGANRQIAEQNAKKYLDKAATMNGEVFALKEPQVSQAPAQTDQTIDIDLPAVRGALGISGAGLNNNQNQRLSTLTFRLREKGYSDSEIQQLAQSCANSRVNAGKVIDNFEAKVEFLADGDMREQAKQFIAKMNEIDEKNVTNTDLNAEMANRLELSMAGVKKEMMDSTRGIEEMVYSEHSKSERQMALDFAGKHSAREMNDSTIMDREIKKMADSLMRDGVLSDKGSAMKRAVEIAERAATYKDTGITTTYNLN